MNNGQLTRWLDEVQRRIDGRLRDHADAVKTDLDKRLSKHEAAVEKKVDGLDAKVEQIRTNCVGCAGEFGSLKEKATTTADALKDHQAEHRWRFGQATALAGTVAGIVIFVLKAVYDWVRHP